MNITSPLHGHCECEPQSLCDYDLESQIQTGIQNEVGRPLWVRTTEAEQSVVFNAYVVRNTDLTENYPFMPHPDTEPDDYFSGTNDRLSGMSLGPITFLIFARLRWKWSRSKGLCESYRSVPFLFWTKACEESYRVLKSNCFTQKSSLAAVWTHAISQNPWSELRVQTAAKLDFCVKQLDFKTM